MILQRRRRRRITIKTRLVECLLFLLALVPLSVARAFARGVAGILSFFNNDISRITQLNIAMTHPQLSAEQQRELSQQSVASTLMGALEMPIVWRKSQAWVEKKVVAIENENLMHAVVAKQKGVIVITPHIGNWEVVGRCLPNYAATTNLYQPPKITAVENVVRRGRELSGAALVPTNQRGIAALLKALRRGEISGILPDQVPQSGSGQFSDFFGQQAYTMTLVYNLIRKTQCSVILVYALRVRGGFKLVFREAPETIYSEDQATSLRALNQMVETAINDDIPQYQWAYKRFKAQPEGKSDPY